MAAKPCAGLKVLGPGTLIAGAFAAPLLAELGAEVIKIESPAGGDPQCAWRHMHHAPRRP
jgi:formyl-CoA transferase